MCPQRPCVLAALVIALAGLAAAGPVAVAQTPANQPEYLAEIASWRHERDQDLRDEDGWLTLAGLFWLQEGDNTFGSAAESALVFPAKAPARLGVLRRAGRAVTLVAAPGAGLTSGGKEVGELALASDASGEPTVVTLGSLSFYVIERGERVGIRLKDKQSPVLAAFKGVESFPIDPTWRIAAHLEPYDPPKQIKIPNVLGDVADSPCPGAVVFERDGVTYRLEPTGEPGHSLFLVFGDRTNGHETYGGGRFLSIPAPGADGSVVLDFNKAYNPPCVFTPYATCPLPPKQNKLTLRIEAGDKMYAAGAHAAGH